MTDTANEEKFWTLLDAQRWAGYWKNVAKFYRSSYFLSNNIANTRYLELRCANERIMQLEIENARLRQQADPTWVADTRAIYNGTEDEIPW